LYDFGPPSFKRATLTPHVCPRLHFMTPLDYFNQKIADMKFFYKWLDYIGQPNKFFKKIIIIENSKRLIEQ
jgi:hypothetical protein